MFKINNCRIIKVVPFIVTFLLFSNSFSLAGSRIIIEGNAFIIIENQTHDTKLFVNNINTTNGGKLNSSDGNDSVEENDFQNTGIAPKSFVIEKAYPNPFNPTTKIKYGVANSTDIEIHIYDLTGRIVKNILIKDKQPGWYEFTWNGTNNYNHDVVSGIYLVSMKAGDFIKKQKVTFIK